MPEQPPTLFLGLCVGIPPISQKRYYQLPVEHDAGNAHNRRTDAQEHSKPSALPHPIAKTTLLNLTLIAHLGQPRRCLVLYNYRRRTWEGGSEQRFLPNAERQSSSLMRTPQLDTREPVNCFSFTLPSC